MTKLMAALPTDDPPFWISRKCKIFPYFAFWKKTLLLVASIPPSPVVTVLYPKKLNTEISPKLDTNLFLYLEDDQFIMNSKIFDVILSAYKNKQIFKCNFIWKSLFTWIVFLNKLILDQRGTRLVLSMVLHHFKLWEIASLVDGRGRHRPFLFSFATSCISRILKGQRVSDSGKIPNQTLHASWATTNLSRRKSYSFFPSKGWSLLSYRGSAMCVPWGQHCILSLSIYAIRVLLP